MIQAVVEMVFAQEKLTEVLHILISVAQRTRAETGCLRCSVYRDAENDQAIIFEEVWRGEDEMRNHLARNEYRNVLLVMEMASFPPEIRFNVIAGTEGVELIERVRTSGAHPGAARET